MLRKGAFFVALLGICFFGVTVAVKNPVEVSLRYYFDLAWEGPLVIALLAVLVIGFFLGLLTGFFRVLALRRELRRHRADRTLSNDAGALPPGSP